MCLSGVLLHMLKLSILFPLQKWDFSKWLAVATVQQLFRFGEGASWPLAPGEGHPRRGGGACKAGEHVQRVTALWLTRESWEHLFRS